MPKVRVWPKCPTCDTAYVIRRCFSLSKGWLWLFQRDCKHKAVEATVVDERPVKA